MVNETSCANLLMAVSNLPQEYPEGNPWANSNKFIARGESCSILTRE